MTDAIQEVIPAAPALGSGGALRWNQIGLQKRERGDIPGALAAFETALGTTPARAELHLNRAICLADLGRTREAESAFRLATSLDPGLAAAHAGLGKLCLVSMRIDAAVAAFEAAVAADPQALEAHLGLYEALQVRGDAPRALQHQRAALAQQRLFFEKRPQPGAPTILMVAVPGDWQANVPLEYLYNLMPVGVHKLFVEAGTPDPGALPRADVVFNAVAQSDAADPTLAFLEGWLPRLGLPVLNDPARVRRLSRDGVARDYADLRGAVIPSIRRVARDRLAGDSAIADLSPERALTLRPVDSQAGNGLIRLESPSALAGYLAETPAEEFFIIPFVDYRSSDGYYRKYRIIFVDGKPYAHHLAISDKWMVHYYNARNGEWDWTLDEEARFLADVESVFDGPRAEVLAELAARVGLDYFGIDCGVMPDGRVVLFEIDVAMIVHLGDPVERYPYKHQYVPRIYDALERMIKARARKQ